MFATLMVLVFGVLPSLAVAADFTPEQVQKWWVAEIDDPHRADGAGLLPYPNTDVTRKMTHTIIEGLWESPDYRQELQAWLAKPRPDIADDVVAQWRAHVQAQVDDSFDSFMPDDVTSTMLQLEPSNVVGTLPRDICEDQTFESLHAVRIQQQNKLLDASGDQLASAILTALNREFALLESPGGKPIETISLMPFRTYQSIRSSLPSSGSARMVADNAHRADGKVLNARDVCLRGWITSHAILDAIVEDPSAHLSARKLRASMAKAGYQEIFHIYNNGIKVPIAGFKPRHDLNLSELIAKGSFSGTANVVFNVDVAGHVGAVSIESSDVRPETVTAVDGTSYKTSDLIESAAADYLRAGVFEAAALETSAASRKMRLPLSF
jgi:hypothetical protein